MRITKLMIAATAIAAAACSQAKPEAPEIIPQPAEITVSDGSFKVAGASFTIGENIPAEAVKAIEDFRGDLETVTGRKTGDKAGFTFTLNENLGPEAYALKVTPAGVSVEAAAFNGFFYAIQSIKQMLPSEIYGKTRAKAAWVLPCVDIMDSPRFEYRGLLMDCCRHFFPIEEVKKVLDLMAIHKMNRLHWHLTEDQGWRIEIKKYPKLTEIGSYRNGTQIFRRKETDGQRYGGFYTQDQLREVVAYAAERGITIIPEIDLPGHMLGALAAYPELGCTGGPYEVSQYWGVFPDVLCPGKEETFTFLEDVLTEVMDIFPSEYIHIGGDECPKVRWHDCPLCQARIKKLGLKDRDGFTKEHYLQNYVTARVQKFLNDHGRKIIGWDEILEGELAEGATVMSWRGTKGGIKAVEKGFHAVMTPNAYMYIDWYQTKERDKEPYRIGHYLPVEKTYSYEPMEGMPENGEEFIDGVQCNLWAEFLKTPADFEYQLLPRMSAASEVGWSPAGSKDYDRFRSALDRMVKVYDQLGFTYCKALWGLVGLPGHEIPARSAEELDTLDYNKVPFMEE